MLKKILLIIIFNSVFNSKGRYSLSKMNIMRNNEPIIFDLLDKNINNVITLTFFFSFQNNFEVEKSFFSFGYYNLFYHYINIYNIDSKLFLRLNHNYNNNYLLSENNFYYIIFEIEKLIIPDSSNYIIKSSLNFGQEFNSNTITMTSGIIKTGKKLDTYFINIGSKEPELLVSFNFSIENLTYYNRKLSNSEKEKFLLLDSIPLIFLDFSNSLSYSQYFHNKLNNEFLGGINGNSINNDKFDLFYEYIRISTIQIRKKLYIFNNWSYIKLPQEIIKYLSLFGIDSYTVYLKTTIHLNNNTVENNLNINLKLYNRENKSGININLIKINENSTKKFEFKVSLIEDLTNFRNIISNNDILNIDYFIIRYEKKLNVNKFNVILNFKIRTNKYELNYLQINNNFLSNDNHYIGDYDGIKYIRSYILIEIEEFMLGKGLEINNLTLNTGNIIYNNINLFCLSLNNNKINRNINLYNNCSQRNENINVSSNCEYWENSNCIFPLPDHNKTIYFTYHLGTIILPVNFFKPNKQILWNIPPNNNKNNINKPSGTSIYNYVYSANLSISGNNIIIYIDINNNNIINNIIGIEFLNKVYSYFIINKNYGSTKFAIEIKNSNSFNNPKLRIINYSGNSQFTINSIYLVEVNSSFITPNTKKIIGEKINNSYKLVENKWYTFNSSLTNNFRKTNNILIKCHSSCITCNGPSNYNCINCKNNYLKYNNLGCIKKKALNCLNYRTNPSFCYECQSNFEKIKIDNNRVKCLCHFSCLTCNSSKINSCLSCYLDRVLYFNNECLPIYPILICRPNFVLKPESLTSVKKCLKCGEGCYSCLISNLNYCNNCLYGYHLFNNKCIRCNEDGKYINKNVIDTNNQYYCSLCHSSCKKCYSNLNNNCIQCYNNRYLLNLGNNLKECSSCNMTGYFKEGLYCKKCNNNCLNCINNSTNCINCKNNYLLDNIKNDCVLDCRIGTYRNGNNCFKCHNNCISCNNENEFSCIECIDNLYLDINNNNCVLCNNLNNIKIGKKCYNCYEKCRKCNGLNYNNCISCKNNYYLYEELNTCVDKCPIKTYNLRINNLNYCRNCYDGCLNCIDLKENSCLSCENNLYYNKYTNRCRPSCEKGYFLLNNECEKCNINCINCINENICLECENKFYLKNNKVCSLCKEEGYYTSNKNCLKCNINCLNCIDYDNCLDCNENKIKIYNKSIKKYYCKINCLNNKIFNKLLNKCTSCEECNNCQIKNEYFCEDCDKCKNNCKFDYKFNETGLFIFNNNTLDMNLTLIKENNLNLIEYSWNQTSYYYFKIKNNKDKLKNINFKLNNLSILKSFNCTYKFNKIFKIKKEYNKNCDITKVKFDNENKKLNIKFNFKINKNNVKDNFYYKITNTTNNKINYEIKNITYLNNNEIIFYFIPNYFKQKFNLTFIFDNIIIENSNCKKQKKLSKIYLIDSKNILFYESIIKINLDRLKINLDNAKLKKTLKTVNPYINNISNSILGTTFFSSLFSQFLSLLVRFFQIVYILDFILLLKLNWGEYTNTFISFIKLDMKLYFELNSFFNISYEKMEKKVNKILYFNPKLKDYEFIYLTNFNVEFIILICIFLIEFLFKSIIFLFKLKKNSNLIKTIPKELINDNKSSKKTRMYSKEIKNKTKLSSKYINSIRNNNKNIWNKKKTLKKWIKKKKNINYEKIIYLIMAKIQSLKFIYIGINLPNFIASVFIYSEIFNEFHFTLDDFKWIIIYIFQYWIIFLYLKEIILSIKHLKLYNKQEINHLYREDFFLFNNNKKGIHNFIILISFVRDVLLIFIGVLVNIKALVQIICFLLVQVIYFIIIMFFKSKYDYKNIKLLKIQEFINWLLIFDTFILYFTKFELFQFIFIISYIFLLLISAFNLFFEVFKFFFYKILAVIYFLINKVRN